MRLSKIELKRRSTLLHTLPGYAELSTAVRGMKEKGDAQEITKAYDYALAHPEFTVAEVAKKFGLNPCGIRNRFWRNGNRRTALKVKGMTLLARKRWEPIFAYVESHPKEHLNDLAQHFGISAGTISQRLVEHFGSTWIQRQSVVVCCRICGEKDPEKFANSSKYRTGKQDKCKVCAKKWNAANYIRKMSEKMVAPKCQRPASNQRGTNYDCRQA